MLYKYFIGWVGFAIFAVSAWGLQAGWVVDDSSVVKQKGTETYLFFNVHFSAILSEPMDVLYTTEDGNAKAGIDYVQTTGVLSLKAGEISKEVVVKLLNNPKPSKEDKYLFLSIKSKNADRVPTFRSKAKGVIKTLVLSETNALSNKNKSHTGENHVIH